VSPETEPRPQPEGEQLEHTIVLPEPAPDFPEWGTLRTFWELSTDLLCIAEADGTFVHVNPAWGPALGWSAQQLQATNAFDLLHPDDVEATRALLERVASGAEDADAYEVRYRTSAGDYRVLRWNARTGMDGRLYAVARDVTEALENERRLRESEERFRLSMTHAPIGKGLVGLDGRFVEVNDELCRILGRSREELAALTFQELTHPDDLEADLELLRALAAGEIDRYDLEKRYFHVDGSTVWAMLFVSALRDESGAPRYYISQVQDITARKRAEAELSETLEQLRQANATLTDFAAITAHDLKSPLAVSASMLELVSMRFGGDLPDQARELFDRVRAQLGRLSTQVDGLLRLAAVTSMSLDLEVLEVPTVAETVIEGLGHTIAGLDIDIDPCPPVLTDHSALAVLLQNLLENASRHGASRVHLHADGPTAGVVRCYLDDDGPGIAEADREHAFDLFFRSGDDGEAGLGLATCRYVVQRQGGEIGLDEAPDGGTRVWFTLPAG
jgi:PAS domain S-box-containing protein